MSWLQDLPIRRKLTVVILITCTVVLVLAFLVLAAFEFMNFRNEIARGLTVLADVLGKNTRAAITFQDEKAATEMLNALQSETDVVAACLFDNENKIFAQYKRSGTNATFPVRPESDGARFIAGKLELFHPVLLNSKRIGTIYLQSDLKSMYDRLKFVGVIAVSVLLGAFIVAFAISARLQRPISNPILALAETAKVIAEQKDYSVRAADSGKNEIGALTDAFNLMLGGIQERESALRSTNQALRDEITERERAEEALLESQENTRAIVDVAMDGIITMSHEGIIVGFNPSAERMFGYKSTNVIGQPLADVIIPPQMRKMHRDGLARYLATGEEKVLGKLIEITALRADGSIIPVELSITRMPGTGPALFTGFLRDITERKLAENRVQEQLARLQLLNHISRAIGERQDLKSIFQVVIQNVEENLPVDFSCIFLNDRENTELSVVSVGSRSVELARELAMEEKSTIQVDANGLSRCLHGRLVYEPDVSKVPFPFPQKLTQVGLRSMVAAPLLVESQVFGILLAARKQSESFSSGECEFLRQLSGHVALASHQAQLHTALQQAYDDLRMTQQAVMQQERLRALGQMASGIAHDINNAISPVSLYTESLLETEKNLSERARDYLKTIQQAVEDVAQTVSRMREFYRQREPQLLLAPVRLNRVVEQVADLTRARWLDIPQKRGIVIELQKDLHDSLPTIMGVESEIREALTNLIFNAVDSMPDGGILSLRTKKVEERLRDDFVVPAQVQLEVSDTGVGMDEETKRRCLEPFFTTKGERGTGLGLAMVYGTAQRHSADLEIESATGKGTTVRLGFTASSVADVSDQPKTAYVVPSRLRLLVIDDDPMLLKSLRDILEADGHVIVTANNGQVGINIFRESLAQEQRFAAVFTDLGMPYVDGRKVASSIKAMSPETPVFLLTGWGQRLIAEGDVPPDVDLVLNKPPKLRDLREALSQYCQMRHT